MAEKYTIPRIGIVKLKKLTTRHLQKLYKELLESGRIQIGKSQSKGLSTTTVHSVHLMLHAALDRAVARTNRAVSRAESIRTFRVLATDFTEANGLLTPSLKVKRGPVMEAHADVIADIYSSTRKGPQE